MIQRYVYDLAVQMGIQVSLVTVVDGRHAGCLDVYLLHVAAGGQRVSALVYQFELDDLKRGESCERLEVKIRTALAQLQVLLEPC